MLQKPQPRLPSAQVRGKKYGLANQMSFEAQSKVERDARTQAMFGQRDARRAGAAKMAAKKSKETGANSGTLGGARGSVASAFFGRGR